MNRRLLYLIIAFLAAGQGMTQAATETNKPSGTLNYDSFKIISDRNIFNASRSGRRKNSGVVRHVPKIDTFSLRGTLTYEKGQHAIFDNGSRQSDLKLGAEINGYRISQITFDNVLLTPAKGEPIKLTIGMGMRREDGGPWALSGRVESSTSSTTTTTSASSSAPDAKAADSPAGGSSEDEVVRRLMEKRRQQLKQ